MSDERLAQARAALADAERLASAGAPTLEPSTGPRSPGAGATEGKGGAASGDPVAVAKKIVLSQLSTAPRTRHQLAQTLRRRGCEDDVATAVLDRMTEVGLVDDEAYARMYVRSRQETKGLAPRALMHELRDKGVDAMLIEAALSDVDPDSERDAARALVTKRLPSLHGLERQVQVRRLAGLLARKGYDAHLSYQVIREAIENAPEHSRD